MADFPLPINNLIDSLSKLPGVGKKTAQRFALFLIKEGHDSLSELSNSIDQVRARISYCKICNNFCENELCSVCDDDDRDKSILCVCEKPSDIMLIEKAGFNGLYHVIGGLISPIDNINPEDLFIDSLIDRSKSVNEIVLATNASVEGDATALYISNLLSQSNVIVSRLARGLPMGGSIEYIDETTLQKSISDRVLI